MRTPKFWQQQNLISAILTPFSCLYAAGSAWDRARKTPQRANVPVISIGNVTAGGAGKTPTTIALIPLLRAIGHTPHILTRGYGGAGVTAHRVTAADTAQTVGDEALLLASGAPTWVGANRFAAANAATAAGATILVCDDALQHHALYKDISILVIDGPFGLGNGKLLPAGPLRESLSSALARCDAAIIIGEDMHNLAAKLTLPTFRAKLAPTSDTAFLASNNWLAFAGIGRPEKFYTTLRESGANLVATRDFPDHHAYTTTEIADLLATAQTHGAKLITTAKDATKIPAEYRQHIQTLEVALALENAESFTQLLHRKLIA